MKFNQYKLLLLFFIITVFLSKKVQIRSIGPSDTPTIDDNHHTSSLSPLLSKPAPSLSPSSLKPPPSSHSSPFSLSPPSLSPPHVDYPSFKKENITQVIEKTPSITNNIPASANSTTTPEENKMALANLAHDAAYDASKLSGMLMAGYDLFEKENFRYIIGILKSNPDTLVVVFRGTEVNWQNLLADFTNGFEPISKSKNECKICNISIGFRKAYSLISTTLRTNFQKHLRAHTSTLKNIIVTGHSLGGALATICAYHLSIYKKTQHFTQTLSLITFGSTRVGDANFANYMNVDAQLLHNIRVVYDEDPIPDYPGLTDASNADNNKYVHVGTEIQFTVPYFYIIKKKNVDNREKKGVWSIVKALLTTASDHSKYLTIEEPKIWEAIFKVQKGPTAAPTSIRAHHPLNLKAGPASN